MRRGATLQSKSELLCFQERAASPGSHLLHLPTGSMSKIQGAHLGAMLWVGIAKSGRGQVRSYTARRLVGAHLGAMLWVGIAKSGRGQHRAFATACATTWDLLRNGLVSHCIQYARPHYRQSAGGG